jgi:hypothetical protein
MAGDSIDEREDSINDAFFAVDMANVWPNTRIVDWPASYHNGAGGVAFADTHGEIRKWLDPQTKPPIKKGAIVTYSVSTPNNVDVVWLQERTTSRK